MIRETHGEEIHLKRMKDDCHTNCEKAVYRIMGISSEEYPNIVADENMTLFPYRET